MKLHQIKTSFGRALTDGSVLICDALQPTEEESRYYSGTVNGAAEWLWAKDIAPELTWPTQAPLTPCPHITGLVACKQCKGHGTTTCSHCGTDDIECDACEGKRVIECDCIGGFIKADPRTKAVSLGDHRDVSDGHPVGISTLYAAIVQHTIGPVQAIRYDVFFKSTVFGFLISGARGKAVVMPYRITNPAK